MLIAMKTLVIIACVLCASFASADVFQKVGDDCPTGSYTSGDYCKAYSSRAAEEDVIERVGDKCPTGTYKSGGFCKSYQ